MKKHSPREIAELLLEASLPNLWIPRQDDIHFIAALPRLGTGKLDLRSVKALAEQLSACAERRQLA